MQNATTGTPSSTDPLVSVVVNNYNYERFLGEAIDSALAQTYRPLEVVVVDDGSTDGSRAMIESYGDRIIAVLKENGGQGSAFNAGFAASRGDVVIFLDSDDVLLPTAAERAVKTLEPGVVKVQWPLLEMDASRRMTGRILPTEPLAYGDMREVTMRDGTSGGVSSPTSGNAWARSFLSRVMPVPETAHRICADAFLFGLAPAFGTISRIARPHSIYRMHGANQWQGTSLEERLHNGLLTAEQQWRVLTALADASGLTPDSANWERCSYYHRLQAALNDIEAIVPEDEAFILVDEARLSADASIRGRRVIPFLERSGCYWGLPDDDAVAIDELERLRVDTGAAFIAFAWPAFWWLDYYAGFASHLQQNFPRVFDNERLIVFRLTA